MMIDMNGRVALVTGVAREIKDRGGQALASDPPHNSIPRT